MFTHTQNLYMGVYSSFICNSQKFEIIQMPFNGWTVNKLWYIRTVEYYPEIKDSSLYMQQHGWISQELCWEQKANPKMLHTIWFYLYNILEMTTYRHGEQTSGSSLEVVRMWERYVGLQKGNRRDPCVNGNIVIWLFQCPYLGCGIILQIYRILPYSGKLGNWENWKVENWAAG